MCVVKQLDLVRYLSRSGTLRHRHQFQASATLRIFTKRFLKRFIRKSGSVTEAPMQYLLKPAGLMRNWRSMGSMGEGQRPSRFNSITTILFIEARFSVA